MIVVINVNNNKHFINIYLMDYIKLYIKVSCFLNKQSLITDFKFKKFFCNRFVV